MQNIAALRDGDWVEEVYLVTAKQISTAKNGVTYLSLKLADRTGEIDGRLWDSADEVAGRFEREDFVRIRGMAANYQGTLQIKIKTLEKVDDTHVDIANFLEATTRNIDEMVRELESVSASLSNPFLRQLMQSFLNDPSFMNLFKRAPAAKSLHHNYIGGLLEHVVELVALCRDVARHFPGVDKDLLMTGVFLHDIGKVKELTIRKSVEYTTEGRLLGHISLGYEMIAEKVGTIPGFPEELAMVLKHIMLSHHGEYEFGSPKRPKIAEAIIINYLDDLAAKINNFQTTMKKENVAEGGWTSYSKMHDRYLYRQASLARENDTMNGEEKRSRAKKPGQDLAATGKLPFDS